MSAPLRAIPRPIDPYAGNLPLGPLRQPTPLNGPTAAQARALLSAAERVILAGMGQAEMAGEGKAAVAAEAGGSGLEREHRREAEMITRSRGERRGAR